MSSTWYQDALFAADVVEVNVRIGLIGTIHHGQWLVEVKDPTDGRLIDMASCPHFHTDRWGEVLAEVFGVARQFIGDQVEPF